MMSELNAEEEDVLPGFNVWLSKKGEGLGAITGSKNRYFVLVQGRNSGAVRINYYTDQNAKDLKGHISIYPTSACTSSDRLLSIVSFSVCVVCVCVCV